MCIVKLSEYILHAIFFYDFCWASVDVIIVIYSSTNTEKAKPFHTTCLYLMPVLKIYVYMYIYANERREISNQSIVLLNRL